MNRVGRHWHVVRSDGLVPTSGTARLGASWLSVQPDSGVIGPGQSSTLTVRYDTGSLLGGQYLAAIVIGSNDPDEPGSSSPFGSPRSACRTFSADPPSLDFGSLFIGQNRESDLKPPQRGSDALVISGCDRHRSHVPDRRVVSETHGDRPVAPRR